MFIFSFYISLIILALLIISIIFQRNLLALQSRLSVLSLGKDASLIFMPLHLFPVFLLWQYSAENGHFVFFMDLIKMFLTFIY